MAKAQVGDLIRLTNVACGAPIKNGEIYEVLWVDEDGDARFVGPDGTTDWYASPHQYEIHRKAGEEDSVVPAKATLHSREKVLPRHEAEAMQDVVNHPNHYTQGRFETIEIIEEITQGYDDGFVSYNIGNVLKYIARAPHKHETPLEDLRKAERYLRYAIERVTQK